MEPLALDDAAALMGLNCRLALSAQDVRALAEMGLLPSLSNSHEGPFSPQDVAAYACKAAAVDPDDIYTITRIVTSEDNLFSPPPKRGSSHVLIVPFRGCGLSCAPKKVPFILIQQLLRWLSKGDFRIRGYDLNASASAIKPLPIGAHGELTVWTSCSETAAIVMEGWHIIESRAAPLSEAELTATPKLFGNKSRMAHHIAAIAQASYPEGSSALDLMSGTGVVARKLAKSFQVYANDGNPYGASFARMQFATFSKDEAAQALSQIAHSMELNRSSLREKLSKELTAEAEFLHSTSNDKTLTEYRKFCNIDLGVQLSTLIKNGRANHKSFPYCFAATHYANAYFGLSQAIDIDSIRYALDQINDKSRRDILIGCLLAVATAVGSNLYFAQPPILSSIGRLKKVLRLRALDVYWEFAAQVRLLTMRPQSRYPMLHAWTGDWRSALGNFSAATEDEQSRFVYLDPPYSKLQYSRYYHVLNVLIKYNYPALSGNGRYPSLQERFASKFEHTPNSSLREFNELFLSCAKNDVGLILSYSDEGFVRPEDLFGALAAHFPKVEIFAQQIRHSPPGSKTSNKKRDVFEYIINCKL